MLFNRSGFGQGVVQQRHAAYDRQVLDALKSKAAVHDGELSAMKRLYGLAELPNRAVYEEIAQPWRPYASIACWYLWRSSE